MAAPASAIDWRVLVETLPYLASIPAALREAADMRAVSSGQVLFRLGDRPRAIFCAITGEVRLIRHTAHGADIVLQRARGGFFAEASLDARAYHCDAVATEVGTILRFPASRFRDALDQDAAFRNAWMAQLAREIRKLRAQCERLSLNTAAERILHYIESEGSDGRVTLTTSRKAWAAELGLSHEALYRTLRRLEIEGRLRGEGNRLVLTKARTVRRRSPL